MAMKYVSLGSYLTLGQVADRLGVQLWRLQRAIDRGLVKCAGKVGRQRVVEESDLAAIRKALAEAGYLKG